MTARELVTDILEDLGVIGAGETPSNEDAQLVLSRMNRWIDSLALEPNAMLSKIRTTEVLVSGTASYTVGTGGDIDIVRPDHFDAAAVIIDTASDPVTELPIELLTDQQWQGIAQKELESPLIVAAYYDRAWTAGLARLYVWPIPNVGTTELVLYSLLANARFTTLDTEVTLAPGYEEYFQTNMLKRIASTFRKSVSPEQREAAREAKLNVKRANNRPIQVGVDDALLQRNRGAGYFNIFTGESK